jgi:CRISPR-associated protein Cas5d
MNVRRNEVGNIIPVKKANQARKTGKPLYSVAPEKIEQRSSLILKNVRYIITAHFVMTEAASPTDNPDKFQGITKRRAESGKCYHQPYFGCREFPAFFKLWDGQYSCPQELEGEKDLGYMLFDMDYSNPGNIQPMFFHAEMKNGIIVIPNKDSKEVLR